MKRRISLLLFFCLNLTALAASPVRINEFLASNGAGLADEDGQFSDWIELYNSSDSSVDLGEWYLTDDPSQLTKWEFPSLVMVPRSYLVVFASTKNRNSPKLHTNFSLDEAGEYLALVQ